MKKIFTFILAVVLLLMPLTANAKGNVYEVAEKHTFKNSDTVLPYRLLMPDNYDESKEYPLLVFFHGAGERGDDNELQFFHCVQYIYDNMPEDCIIVVPQCPIGNQWVDTPWSKGAYTVEKVPESNELHAVIELLNELQDKYSVDSNRIYAAGISMGGFAVWDVMIRHNNVFAAGIAVCGGGDPTKAQLLKDVPMFVFHGDADPDVPVSGSRDTVKAIRNAGGKKIEYTEYAGLGHGIWNTAFATKGLFDKLLKCKLTDRLPSNEIEVSDKSNAVSESSADENESNAENNAKDNAENDKDNTVLILVLSIILALVLIIGALLILNRKKPGETK
ncbi:MAG: prolyl oligopeptidase family serine peptidase [Clostridia bacterium]|nr:prolyl oligopeptidase family serine peptidase [Clostridia bacterium]